MSVFPSQIFSQKRKDTVIENNIGIDMLFGHDDVIHEFVKRMPKYTRCLNKFTSFGRSRIQGKIEFLKAHSMLMTIIMLTGKCNANCESCYTDRRVHSNPLKYDEIENIILQTNRLGSKLLYIPGEGEPTLDESLFKVLELARDLEMKVIMYTNGILLSNDNACMNQWGMNSLDFIRKLADYPIYVYFKLWSTRRDLASELMGIDFKDDMWQHISNNKKDIELPTGLVKLIKTFKRSRVGIQCMVDARNIDEISNIILPLCKRLNIHTFIEPPLHSGRIRGNYRNDPPPDKLNLLQHDLMRISCDRASYKIVVHNNGIISPGLAFNPCEIDASESLKKRFSIRESNGKIKNIFDFIHKDYFMTWARYQIHGCLCQRINDSLFQNNSNVNELKNMLLTST